MEMDSSGTSEASFTVRTMPVPPQAGHAPVLLKARSSAAGAEELLNTEAPGWGGADKSKPKALHTSDGRVYGRDYTLTVDLPAMGSRMFKLTPEAPRPEAAQARRRAAAARRKAARTQNAKADAAAYNSKK